METLAKRLAEGLDIQLGASGIRIGKTVQAAAGTLEKLIHEYPQSTQAFAAQRRLNMIVAEAKVARLKSASRRIRLPAG